MKAIALLLVYAGLACAADNSQVRGKKLIDDAIQALGGDNFLHMRDRVEEGRAYSFYRDRLTGLTIAHIYTRYDANDKGPLKVKERQAFGKKEDAIVLFDGSNGYNLTYRGAKPIEKERYERYVMTTQRNIFYILRERLHEPGMIFEYKGSDVFENLPVDTVDITDSEGNVVTVMFSASTHLPTRQVYARLNPEDRQRDEEVTRFTKYRNVDGVQWPFTVERERNGDKIFQLYAESVQINKSLKDSMFALPPGTKVLPPDEKREPTPLPSKTKEELHKEREK